MVKAVIFSNNSEEAAVFYESGVLSVRDISGKEKKTFQIDNVKADYASERGGGIRMYFHSPYVCVTERFGLNAVVVNIDTKEITKLSREDYCSEVSSYSIGFLDYKDKTLLLHQTQWNRLDITDLSAGKLLSEREVWRKPAGKKYSEQYKAEVPEYEDKNYSDYFHSLIHVSSDSSHFLSNGWLWHPVGEVCAFKTEDFFISYEPGGKHLGYWNPYNWDRPCAFIDSTRFVVATDDNDEDWMDSEYKDNTYKQLWFFNIEDFNGKNIPPYKKLVCDVFKQNNEKEIAGELYYDSKINKLIALTEKGAFVLTLDGEITVGFPNIQLPERSNFGFIPDQGETWRYSVYSHVFYRYNNESKNIELMPIEN